ncbi:Fatty acid amide hydrolase 1 [Orchesella cincta]|uniref:Fatty acid amide hydrolase 1 n=1 Tax=Orchesella cincta TaxID=48709 RepID=A0A1D2M6N9_ORCCI|nr:Fatty acid amide hydrolase 1 [Orchesella cincta]
MSGTQAKKIVELPSKELVEQLQSRKLTATQVLTAYTAKALELTERVNCVTEFIPQAPEWASELDKLPTVTGPLHGIPIAVKEDGDIEGMDSTVGFAKLLYNPMKEHSTLVKILLKLGAVPFCKVNVPQSMFSMGSENPIYGLTLNSINEKMGPGGSSSGSGSIVGGGGALIATGSDSAGSCRIPAVFHGICSMIPSTGRMSDKGVLQCLPGYHSQPDVPGFLAKDTDILALVFKSVLENNIQNDFDPLIAPIPWNETLFSSTKALKIGYYTSIPYFPAFPDVQKTVLKAKHALESAGHQVVHFDMPDSFHYLKTNMDMYSADRGLHFLKMFEENQFLLVRLIEEKDISANDEWNMILEKKAIQKEVLEKMDEAGIDLILGPAYPFPALVCEDVAKFQSLQDSIVYTMFWNFVNFPAGIVPFGNETGEHNDEYDDEGEPMFKVAKELIKDSAGMPINVQVSARPFKEELVLRALVELEKLSVSK